MKDRVVDTSSEEEEEEEDVPVRRSGGFRMISGGTAAANTAGQSAAVPQAQAPAQAQQQQQAQIDAARARQLEAVQKAREKALKLQAEARARAEAARADALRQYQQQQLLKAQQEAAEQRAQQLEQLQQAQQQQNTKTVQQQQGQQQVKAQQQPVQQQKKQQPAVAPKQQAPVAQQQQKPAAQQQKPRQLIPSQKQQNVVQQPQQQQRIQSKPAAQQKSQEAQRQQQQPVVQQRSKQQQSAQNHQQKSVVVQQKQQPAVSQQQQKKQIGQKSVVQQQQQQHGESAKFGAHPPPILTHRTAGSDGAAEKHQVLEDASWQLQRRVPQEDVAAICPERIKVSDFLYESEPKPTVIVLRPAQSTRVQWNEFPEKSTFERQAVPRVRAQNWQPANDTEHVVQRTGYQPGRIAAAWPPLGVGNDDAPLDLGRAASTKAIADDGWIQSDHPTEEPADWAADGVGNTPWRRQVAGGAVRSRVWPPPIDELEAKSLVGRPKLSVQWPPAESEEKEQADVKSLQTHLPVKPHQRQWPPVGSETILVGE